MTQVEVSKFSGGAVYTAGEDDRNITSKLSGGTVYMLTEPVQVSKFSGGAVYFPLPVLTSLNIDLRYDTLNIRLN